MYLVEKCCCGLKQCRCILCVDVLLVNNIQKLLHNTNSSVNRFHLFTPSNLNVKLDLSGSLSNNSNICMQLFIGSPGQRISVRGDLKAWSPPLNAAASTFYPACTLLQQTHTQQRGTALDSLDEGWLGGCIGQQFWRRNRTLPLISYFLMYYVCLWVCELHVGTESTHCVSAAL